MTYAASRVVASDEPDFQQKGCQWIRTCVDATLQKASSCSVALAGGTAPLGIYQMLASSFRDMPWNHVRFYWGDERAVRPDDEHSNFRAASRHLLEPLGIDSVQIFRMEAERSDIHQAAEDYALLLPDALDLLLLGMGEDGHTASIFPGESRLFADAAAPVAAVRGPKPPPLRLTITPNVIQRAKHVLVIAKGQGKAAAAAEAWSEPMDAIRRPIQLTLNHPGCMWLLDAGAAAGLPSSPR